MTVRANAEDLLIRLFHLATLGLFKGVPRPKLFDRCACLLRPRNILPARLPVSAFEARRKSVLQPEEHMAGQCPSATYPLDDLSECTRLQNAYSPNDPSSATRRTGPEQKRD